MTSTSGVGRLLASCPCQTPGHSPSGSALGGTSCPVQDCPLGGPEASSPCFLLGGRKKSFLFLLVPPGSETCSQPCRACARVLVCMCLCVCVSSGGRVGVEEGREPWKSRLGTVSAAGSLPVLAPTFSCSIHQSSVCPSIYLSSCLSVLMKVVMSQLRMRVTEDLA